MSTLARATRKVRLAFIVSHPIQYYAPLHQRLALRDDIEIKVFFTWHDGSLAIEDRGFARPVAWDIPLTRGYAFERVPNRARDPGTHHFFGLRNPSLVAQVCAWHPDAVHVTGWGWLSHVLALRAFHARCMPILFRGDSHLLDGAGPPLRRLAKQALLRRVYAWPAAFLVVGEANRRYYEAFGVGAERLYPCPHSIDVGRFAEPADVLEREAAGWRRELDIPPERCVVLFAGKFERKKRPLELMQAMLTLPHGRATLIMLGSGELEPEVRTLAASDADRFRVLAFENQQRMPVAYRLADLFVLPSSHGETWGLAVNEAMACGRAVLVSDRVGCAADVVDPSCGQVFALHDPAALSAALHDLTARRDRLHAMGRAAAERARAFDVAQTEAALVACMDQICVPRIRARQTHAGKACA
jgi:glycosyltransferase involved in cell wall biosynthesis